MTKPRKPRTNPALADHAEMVVKRSLTALKNHNPATLIHLRDHLESLIKEATSSTFPELGMQVNLADEQLFGDDEVLFICPWCTMTTRVEAVSIAEGWTKNDEIDSVKHQGLTLQFDVDHRGEDFELLYLRCDGCKKPVAPPAGVTIEWN